MRHTLIFALLAVILFGGVRSTQGLDYMYFSHTESSPETNIFRFFAGDTLWGPVRSNDTIDVMQRPVFHDYLITSHHIEYWYQASPIFAIIPIVNAPELSLIDNTLALQAEAADQGLYLGMGPGTKAFVRLEQGFMNVSWVSVVEPYDTVGTFDVPLWDDATAYFACPIDIEGVCSTTLTIAAEGDIGLTDNIVYPSWDESDNSFDADETAKLLLISEEQMFVRNTWANGRENCAQGCNIVIHAYLVALGGAFTFDQQNDFGDDYVCDCVPDERGSIIIYGGIANRSRGYVHRSNNGGTGYLKSYHWDDRLHDRAVPLFDEIGVEVTPVELNFGEVVIGESRELSVTIVPEQNVMYYLPEQPASPFSVNRDALSYNPHWEAEITLPVMFTPPGVGLYTARIFYYLEGREYSFTVSGNGVLTSNAQGRTELPAEFSLSAYPNPFNPSTTIAFHLPQATRVSLEVYDVRGGLARTLADDVFTAGSHALELNGASLPSGIYFARLSTNNYAETTKLLLVK